MTTTLITPTPPVAVAVTQDIAIAEPDCSLRFRMLPAGQLGMELTQAWSDIQQSDRALESPFFRPEYTSALASARNDVFVTIALHGDEPVAFFPFQRGRWGTAVPVGGPLTDYQGIIARTGIKLDLRRLLKESGLRCWRFDHVPAAQRALAPFSLIEDRSPSIDLSCGLETYLAQRRKASKNEFFQTERKTRKIQREIGSLRLEAETCDLRALEMLIAWKTPQYRHTRTTNIFEYEWVLTTIRNLLAVRQPHFSASFARLYVNDELLGINFGIRSGDVYHSWMTTYNHAFAPYAPGRILLLEIIKSAPQQGIRVLDMGRGREQFKGSFANSSTPILEGAVERLPLTRWFRRRWIGAREWARQSPHRDAIRTAWSWVRPLRDRVRYR